jgi:phosphatidylglycerophosphate synthase
MERSNGIKILNYMRKLPRNYDNPVDNIIVDIADKLNPYFRRANLTPNVLTTFNLLFAIYAIYFFTKQAYEMSAICFGISYFFDCADGNFARKYGMVSKFGDYYDHIVDIFKFSIILSMLVHLLYINNQMGIILVLSLLGILSSVHYGCQEIYTDENHGKFASESLAFSKKMCPTQENLLDVMKISRFFSSGTFVFSVFAIIFFLKKLIR